MIYNIKKQIEKDFKVLKFEDEINQGNGFVIKFTNDCCNILDDTLEKLIRWKEDLEDEFEEIQIEIESNNDVLYIIIGGF